MTFTDNFRAVLKGLSKNDATAAAAARPATPAPTMTARAPSFPSVIMRQQYGGEAFQEMKSLTRRTTITALLAAGPSARALAQAVAAESASQRVLGPVAAT